jgi:uncharacterized protein (TIGR02265 family)
MPLEPQPSVPVEEQVDGSVMEGLFVRCLGAQGEFAEELRRVGVDVARLEPVYPRSQLRTALEVAWRHALPNLTREEAFRHLGRLFTEGMLQTLLGRVIGVAVVMSGPDRIMAKMDKHIRSGRRPTNITVVTEQLEPAHWRCVVHDLHAIPEFFMGTTEAWLRRAGGEPKVTLVRTSASGFELDVRW